MAKKEEELVPAFPPTPQYLADPQQKALANRLARIDGHVRAVRQMVLERRCADEILLQVAAIKAALNKVASTLLEHELHICVKTCMEGDAEERLAKITRVLSTLMKHR